MNNDNVEQILTDDEKATKERVAEFITEIAAEYKAAVERVGRNRQRHQAAGFSHADFFAGASVICALADSDSVSDPAALWIFQLLVGRNPLTDDGSFPVYKKSLRNEWLVLRIVTVGVTAEASIMASYEDENLAWDTADGLNYRHRTGLDGVKDYFTVLRVPYPGYKTDVYDEMLRDAEYAAGIGSDEEE